MKNIIIPNSKKINSIINKIYRQGANKLFILADFDSTLTKEFVRGHKSPSLISILRDYNYLSADYPAKAKQLYKKYAPLEYKSSASKKQKTQAMEKWWLEHGQLLRNSGLKKKDIRQAMASGKILLRPGVKQFLKQLEKQNIPLIIISSSGLGTESIKMFLRQAKVLYKNIFVISNILRWGKKGNFLGFKKPIIHSLNKNILLIKHSPKAKHALKKRGNVILLGDVVADKNMIKGYKYNNLLSIGFLNCKIRKNLAEYKKHFDAIIPNDGNFNYINLILNSLKN